MINNFGLKEIKPFSSFLHYMYYHSIFTNVKITCVYPSSSVGQSSSIWWDEGVPARNYTDRTEGYIGLSIRHPVEVHVQWSS